VTDEGGAAVATASTDSAGSYRFPGLPEGLYTLSVDAPGSVATQADITAGETLAADLALSAQ
jgi:hypothetical protein